MVWALPRTSFMTGYAIYRAGLEIRECLTHIFATGFPKSYDLAKGLETYALTGSANWNEFRKLKPVTSPLSEDLKQETDHNLNDNSSRALGYTKLQHDQGYRGKEYPSSGAFDLVEPVTRAAQVYQGYGTALKPASEHWYVARKPLSEKNLVENVLKWGTGGLNIDACRVGTGTGEVVEREYPDIRGDNYNQGKAGYSSRAKVKRLTQDKGRWPTNLIFSHSLFCDTSLSSAAENGTGAGCVDGCPVLELDRQSGTLKSGTGSIRKKTGTGYRPNSYGKESRPVGTPAIEYGDQGGASRFYPQFEYNEEDRAAMFLYAAKAAASEKNAGCENLPQQAKVFNGQSVQPTQSGYEAGSVEDKFSTNPQGNFHPTVKNLKLMSWLISLVAPPIQEGQPAPIIGDCFAGSGSTGVAALGLGYNFIGAEENPDFVNIIQARLSNARAFNL